MGTLILPIPEEQQVKRDWVVEIDGKVLPQVGHIKISFPVVGEFNYGLTPNGWDGWSFCFSAGGGVVIAPYTIINDEIYIGVITESRYNLGGEIQNLPGGLVDEGETHYGAAVRELGEETGFKPNKRRVFQLDGAPMNFLSAYLETVGEDEGECVFAVEVMREELEFNDGKLVFKTDIAKLSNEAKEENIIGCEFIHWKEAVKLRDGQTVATVARLLAHLL